MRHLPPLALAFALALPAAAAAQAGRAQPTPSMPGMEPGDPPPAAAPPSSGTAEMEGTAGMEGMGAMTGQLGPYPMTRDASGTSWQPQSARMDGVMFDAGGGWSAMVHGYATLVHNDQGGPRGDTKTFVESMFMGMAQHPLAGGTLTVRAMGSLDPFMGKSGYPLLLQTGETANGRTPLTDRQHPHDLVAELAGVYSRPLAGRLNGFVYVGWPGEPALGPATYMHRFSGLANPEAPIGHHWLDSTHITFGVVTAGLVYGGVKLEASSFTGREPNQHRYDWDHPRFDSWSVRATWNPSPDWSMQVSRGHLVSPEQLEPEEDQDRTTASATWNRAVAWRGRRGQWQATAAWGRDEVAARPATDAFLLDSALNLGRHTVFARLERVDKDELFADRPTDPLNGPAYTVGKASFGYFLTTPMPKRLDLDLGALVSRYDLPRAIRPAYGGEPTSFMLFSRLKLR